MKNLLLSGETLESWNLIDVLSNDTSNQSKSKDIERLLQFEMDNTIGRYCNGFSYYEIEQMDKFNK